MTSYQLDELDDILSVIAYKKLLVGLVASAVIQWRLGLKFPVQHASRKRCIQDRPVFLLHRE